MLQFNRTYFSLSVVLLATEIIIGLYMHDAYIRPFGGDFLVVILLYCAIKSFLKSDVNYTALGVMLFAYFIEWCQWLNVITLLNLQHSAMARMLLGTSFAWADILMYTLGTMFILLTERIARCL